MRFLRAYLARLGPLAAERSLTHVAELQAADAWGDADERRAMIRAWQQEAEQGRPRRAPTEAEFFAAMQDLGFRVM